MLLCLIGYGMLQAPNFSINGNTVKNSKYKCKQDAQLLQRNRAAVCVIVFDKSRRLELGDNILWTL